MSYKNYNWIFESSENIKNIKPHAFLLKKAQHGRFLNSFRLKVVKTNQFQKSTEKKLIEITTDIKNKSKKIKKFHSDFTDDYDYFVLDKTKHSYIRETITELFQTADTNPISSLKTMTKMKISAVVFKMPDNKSIIAIDTVSVYDKEALEGAGLLATYDELGIEELKKDSALIFNFNFPCLFFEETGQLLVLDKKLTERIFNFSEIYIKKSTEIFEKLQSEEIIEIDEAVLQKELKTLTMSRRINNMIEDNQFKTDIAIYKKYESFLKRHPEFVDEYTKLTIKNDKVLIKDEHDFRSFVFMTGFNILKSVVGEDKYYIAFKKRKVEINESFKIEI